MLRDFLSTLANSWTVIILGFLVAFAVTWYVIPSIVHTSMLKNLGAVSNGRTSHKNPTPTLGGIAVFAGFVFSTVLIAGTFFDMELMYLICGMAIILFIGIKDDILVVDPWKKLTGQIIASSIVIIFADIRIDNFYGLFGINQIPYLFSVAFSAFVFLVIVNGINLIDGIDGLASGIGILVSSIFGSWFWLTGNNAEAALCFALVGSLIAFFYFNVFSKKNKLFLGDTGSLLTGFLLGIFAFRVFQLNQHVNDSYFIKSVPAVVSGILILPLFDTLRVFSIRILQGKSPFAADRQHIHHRILQVGFTHIQATILLLSVNIIFIALNFLLQGIGILNLMLFNLGLASLLSYALFIEARNRTRKKQSTEYIFEGTWKKEILSRSKTKDSVGSIEIEEESQLKSTDPEDGKELTKKNIPEVLPVDKKEEKFAEIRTE
jgi:UDP-N-acetylmuramyl pentapeptide phosphotransferase/UDP-N-acetylglucosamine-1-phosphate transferase